jgi:2-iminobutanoate/2-iminopropanoate deaminase
MKTIVSTEKAPAAIGPYSQAVKAGGFLFASGQIPLNPATGEVVEGGIVEQTRRVLDNITALLASQGLTLEKVVKTTVFLKDLNDFQEMNAIYAEYFTANYPARSTVQVAKLPKDVKIEIEVIVAL